MMVDDLELTITEQRRRRIIELIREFQGDSNRGASIIRVMDQAKEEGLPLQEFSNYLASILKEGLVYETDQEHIRTTK